MGVLTMKPVNPNTPIEELATQYVMLRHNPRNYTFGGIHEEIQDRMSELFRIMADMRGVPNAAREIGRAEKILQLMGMTLIK